MKVHEQRNELVRAMELALPELHDVPPLSAFGEVREDCALVHMDYFHGIQMAASVLVHALADVKDEQPHETYHRLMAARGRTA